MTFKLVQDAAGRAADIFHLPGIRDEESASWRAANREFDSDKLIAINYVDEAWCNLEKLFGYSKLALSWINPQKNLDEIREGETVYIPLGEDDLTRGSLNMCVPEGTTLYHLAKLFGLRHYNVLSNHTPNGIANADCLTAGADLFIPVGKQSATLLEKPVDPSRYYMSVSSQDEGPELHTLSVEGVRRFGVDSDVNFVTARHMGSLETVARLFDVPVATLQHYNPRATWQPYDPVYVPLSARNLQDGYLVLSDAVSRDDALTHLGLKECGNTTTTGALNFRETAAGWVFPLSGSNSLIVNDPTLLFGRPEGYDAPSIAATRPGGMSLREAERQRDATFFAPGFAGVIAHGSGQKVYDPKYMPVATPEQKAMFNTTVALVPAGLVALSSLRSLAVMGAAGATVRNPSNWSRGCHFVVQLIDDLPLLSKIAQLEAKHQAAVSFLLMIAANPGQSIDILGQILNNPTSTPEILFGEHLEGISESPVAFLTTFAIVIGLAALYKFSPDLAKRAGSSKWLSQDFVNETFALLFTGFLTWVNVEGAHLTYERTMVESELALDGLTEERKRELLAAKEEVNRVYGHHMGDLLLFVLVTRAVSKVEPYFENLAAETAKVEAVIADALAAGRTPPVAQPAISSGAYTGMQQFACLPDDLAAALSKFMNFLSQEQVATQLKPILSTVIAPAGAAPRTMDDNQP